jgi:hypothetical protein
MNNNKATMKEMSKQCVSDYEFDHGPDHVQLQANSKRTDTYELSVAFGPKTVGVDFEPPDLSVLCLWHQRRLFMLSCLVS